MQSSNQKLPQCPVAGVHWAPPPLTVTVSSFSGYYAEHNAIIVFAACFLPDSNCDNYNYVMENLFL